MARRMNRRGQLTIFLAAGVVVVFAFMFLYILSFQVNNNSILAVNENVPPPLLSYIKNTLEDAARGAVIETIAPQSGYQDPASAENQQPTLFFGKELEMNFESEDVRYQTLEEYPYPEYPYTMPPEAPPHPVTYYYLLGKFNIPSLERIQKELLAETEKRFNENLDLTPFEGQYYRLVYPEQEPVITLDINFEDITVDLHYPLEILTEDQHSRLPNMTVNLALRLNRTYELANCLVDKVVFDEGRDTYDPLDEAPDGDPFQECKTQLKLDDFFTTRTVPVIIGGEFKGRLVGINDTRNQENTGVSFEFQYLIWKCSGNFFADATSAGIYDEQRMRVCEYACAKEIPEAVALGICQQESTCDHFIATPPAEPKTNPHSTAMGIFQLLDWFCSPGKRIGGDGSFIDSNELVRKDIEDNIECGMDLMLNNVAFSGTSYCCPSSIGGAETADHLACLQPDHPCVSDPDNMCCGFYEGDKIFEKCECKECDWYEPDPLPGDPTHQKRMHGKNCEQCRGYNLNEDCCDPRASCGIPGTLGGQSRGCCCDPSYAIEEASYETVYGNTEEKGLNAERDLEMVKWAALTKDATYEGWDAAIRGYLGYLCGDPSTMGISDAKFQNYVELIHRWMKTDGGLYGTYFYLPKYPNERRYSICYSFNRPDPEWSSTETELYWSSDYYGVMPEGGVNPYGCCCDEDDDCCKEYRLEAGSPSSPSCDI